MAVLNVPTDFATITLAEANASAGDVIVVASGYAGNETVTVSVENLTIDAPADVENISVVLGAGVVQFNLAGESSIVATGNDLANVLVGNAGANVFDGGGGQDRFIGLDGSDTFVGGGGADFDIADYSQDAGAGGTSGIRSNQRENASQGGLDPDTVIDGFGNADSIPGVRNIVGTDFRDEIFGGGNANVLSTLGGDDYVFGFDGADTVDAGSGDDVVEGGNGPDTLDGGDGVDYVAYETSTSGVTVDLAGGTATDSSGSTDTLSNFENVLGSNFGDTITGDGGDNSIRGLAGNDVLVGGGGDGIDTAIYSGNIGDYIITELSDGSIRLEDNRGGVPDGIDTASDFEFFQFADGVVSVEDVVPPTNSRVPVGAIEAVAGNDVLFGDAAGELADVFFFDTELIASLGKDGIKAFGPNDAIVTTSLIYDSNHDEIVTFGGNGKLDLPGATGDGPANPHDASLVGQVEFDDPSGHSITRLHYDGSVEHDSTTYYVYSQIGSGVHLSDLVFA
ncbi:MAG: calcium-binding protein [Mesorhizobium sp.]|nr:MAG: calcium-binding protein [Mesorhizobium sp.]